MTNLSPAAQAVKDAVLATYSPDLPPKSIWALEQAGIAAALRALAVRINGADAIRQDVLDIVNELEAQ